MQQDSSPRVLVGSGIIIVLPAIYLNAQASFLAEEINDEASDRVLATELESTDAAVSEKHPEKVFGISLVTT